MDVSCGNDGLLIDDRTPSGDGFSSSSATAQPGADGSIVRGYARNIPHCCIQRLTSQPLGRYAIHISGSSGIPSASHVPIAPASRPRHLSRGAPAFVGDRPDCPQFQTHGHRSGLHQQRTLTADAKSRGPELSVDVTRVRGPEGGIPTDAKPSPFRKVDPQKQSRSAVSHADRLPNRSLSRRGRVRVVAVFPAGHVAVEVDHGLVGDGTCPSTGSGI